MYRAFIFAIALLTALYTSAAVSAEEAPRASEETLCYDQAALDQMNAYEDTEEGFIESITYEMNCEDMVLTAKMTTKQDVIGGLPANIESLEISMQTFFCSDLGKFAGKFEAGWKIRFDVHNNENSNVDGFWIYGCTRS